MGNNDVNGLFCVLLLAGLVPSNLSSLVTKPKIYQLLSQGEIRTFAYLFQCHCAWFRLTFWTFTTPQVIGTIRAQKNELSPLYTSSILFQFKSWTIWWTLHQFASLNSSTHDFVSNLIFNISPLPMWWRMILPQNWNFPHFTSCNLYGRNRLWMGSTPIIPIFIA